MRLARVSLLALTTISLAGFAASSPAFGRPAAIDAHDNGDKSGHSKLFVPEEPDNALFAKLKDEAKKKPRLPGTGSSSPSPTPTILKQTVGISDPGWSPPDWNGAAGTSRYIEVINNRVGFYNTTDFSLVSEDTTFALAATMDAYVSDPEIVYDPASKKFYYAMMDMDSSGSWFIDYGFSKTAAPNSVADFCHYSYAYGATEPDYPRLGGTKDFILIGTNNFTSSGYANSSVQWAKKPSSASLTSCPTSLTAGVHGGEPFTPVPAHQTDPSSAGFIVASVWYGGSTLSLQKVTKNSKTGLPVFGAAKTISVAPYNLPDDAPQPGTSDMLSTLDSRLYEAVQSFDPRLGTAVIWTANTVFAGAGSGVQFYELGTSGSVAQQGVISDSSRYVFNGTVSSDRAYTSGKKKAYGSNMGATFTTSSATSYPSMLVATKRGLSGLSPFVQTAAGTAAITCGGTCRWGDRSSANPGLAAPTNGTTGRLWLTNGWSNGGYQSENVQLTP